MAMETMITSHEVEGIKKLRRLTKDNKFCMLTTVDESGVLRSRPMAIQKMEGNGDIYILIGKNTSVAAAVEHNDYVNASFANNSGDVAVSVSGRARILGDRRKMEELWEPIFQVRFPLGPDDPNLVLLKIELETAEHWDSRQRVLSTLVGKDHIQFKRSLPVRDDSGQMHKKCNCCD